MIKLDKLTLFDYHLDSYLSKTTTTISVAFIFWASHHKKLSYQQNKYQDAKKIGKKIQGLDHQTSVEE